MSTIFSWCYYDGLSRPIHWQVGVLELVGRRQEEWKGRLDMMENGRCTKKVYEGVVEGKRPRGRPRLRWIDNFKWFMLARYRAMSVTNVKSICIHCIGMTSCLGDMSILTDWLIDWFMPGIVSYYSATIWVCWILQPFLFSCLRLTSTPHVTCHHLSSTLYLYSSTCVCESSHTHTHTHTHYVHSHTAQPSYL